MKVLYISSGDDKYGAPKSMMELVGNMKARHNIDPIVLTCSHGKINSWCDENNITNYVLGHGAFMVVGGSNLFRKIVKHSMYPYLKFKYLYNLNKTKAKIEYLLKDEKIDIVHTNVNRVDIGAYYANKNSIPHVWHLREFGKEDYNCMILKRNAYSYMNKNANKFIAISKIVKTAWYKKGLDISKIETVYNGIDISKFHSDSSCCSLDPNGKIRFVFAGIISETKGQFQLIKAIEQLSAEDKNNIIVDFYGGGRDAYIRKLKKYVENKKLDNIISFKGYSSNLPEVLLNYDVGVVASRAEAFGRVTVEYMAAGLCVIASDTGANSEIIEDNITGYLYNYNDIGSLKKAIEKVLNNKYKMLDMRKKAFEEARLKYSMDRCSDEIYDIYKMCVGVE